MDGIKSVKHLSLEDMDKVNGGLVVEGNNGRYYAVDDKGCVIVSASQKEVAAYGAKMNGLTQGMISESEYEKQFGRKLDETWNPYS